MVRDTQDLQNDFQTKLQELEEKLESLRQALLKTQHNLLSLIVKQKKEKLVAEYCE